MMDPSSRPLLAALWARARPFTGHRGTLLVATLRRIGAAVLVLIVFGGLLALQVDSWRERRQGATIQGRVHADLPNHGDELAPNLHHIWGSAVPGLFLNAPDLSSFGRDLVKYASEGWPTICRLDSDNDGAKNGDELGDPCCEWVPGKVPTYRVWNLSHPGFAEPDDKFLLSEDKLEELSPASCDDTYKHSEDAKLLRRRQFESQYYMHHTMDTATTDSLRWLKYPCILGILLVLGHWAVNRGLLRDVFGFGPACNDRCTSGSTGAFGKPESEGDLSWKSRLMIYVVAYYWTDGVAGLTHLTFDFCPQWYPIIGSVARGFQFHHFHPTAWVVVPFAMMLSHALPLLGLLSLALTIVPPGRRFRAFWSLTYVLCLVTVMTHRWVHFQPEENYWWFRLLQESGLLMSHEHHMTHHDSLVTQFSNLSGVTDFMLDYVATNWLPPTEYQNWLMVCLLYFAVPIALGAEPMYRDVKKVGVEEGHASEISWKVP